MSSGHRCGFAGLAVVVLAALAMAAPPGDKPEKAKGSKDKSSKSKTTGDGSIVSGTLGAELDAYCRSAERFKSGLSGSVLVAKAGKVVLQQGYGIANADKKTAVRGDALWDWCSVTKQFTAAAILKLEMQKKLSIDDPISKHLKDVPKDKAKVTLRHLLNHTSGIGYRDGFGQAESSSKDALIKWFVTSPVASEPGAKWEYSNAAYFVLGALVEMKSGKTWEKYLREELFVPAGMTQTRCIGDPDLDLDRVPLDERGAGQAFEYGPQLSWGYRAAGGVVAPVGDMLLWDRALRGTKVLSEAAKRAYYTVGQNNYACGWEVSNWMGGTVYAHSGHTGQVVTYFFRCIDPDIVVAIAFNEEPPPIHPGTLAQQLAELAKNAD